MKPTLNPYLSFQNNASEAMKFYQGIFGGELTIQTFGESGQTSKPEEKDLVMHARLENDLLSFMASDTSASMNVTVGDNIKMSIMGSDETLLTGYFNTLAQGGSVEMPLAKQFWGDTFGMLTDKFGIHWMVNISSGAPQK